MVQHGNHRILCDGSDWLGFKFARGIFVQLSFGRRSLCFISPVPLPPRDRVPVPEKFFFSPFSLPRSQLSACCSIPLISMSIQCSRSSAPLFRLSLSTVLYAIDIIAALFAFHFCLSCLTVKVERRVIPFVGDGDQVSHGPCKPTSASFQRHHCSHRSHHCRHKLSCRDGCTSKVLMKPQRATLSRNNGRRGRDRRASDFAGAINNDFSILPSNGCRLPTCTLATVLYLLK